VRRHPDALRGRQSSGGTLAEVKRTFLYTAWGLLLALGAAAACVGDDPETAPVTGIDIEGGSDSSTADTSLPLDAGAGADTSVDAATDASRRCSIDTPFSAPTLVPDLSTPNNDYGVTLTGDGRTVYLATGAGAINIYVKTLGPDASFENQTLINNLPPAPIGGTQANFRPSISADGTELFFTRGVGDDYDIFRADINAGGAASVGVLPNVTDLDAAVDESTPHLVNSKVLYFARAANGSSFQIYRAERPGPGLAFNLVTAAPGLGKSVLEVSPVVTDDELTIYFGASAGTFDEQIYVATRGKLTDPFGPSKKVPELEFAGQRNQPTWMSADRCKLYFLSMRNSAVLNTWVATREPK
jgi:hypothetical protein